MKGIHYDIPFDEYLAVRAYGSSALRAALVSPADVIDPDNQREKAGQEMGRNVHLVLGEHDKFLRTFVPEPSKEGYLHTVSDIRAWAKERGIPFKASLSKEGLIAAVMEQDPLAPIWDAFQRRFQFENEGKTIVPAHEYRQLESVREAALEYRPSKLLLEHPKTRFEVSLFWQDQDTGVQCKGRLDVDSPVASVIADWKTCDSAAQARFRRMALFQKLWHVQAAMYLDGMAAIGSHRSQWWWGAIEVSSNKDVTKCKMLNGQPKGIAMYKLTDEQYQEGRTLYKQALERIAEAERTGVWTGYSQEVVDL